MAKSTPHSALIDAGFKFAEESSQEGGRGVGTITTRSYTKKTGVVGGRTLIRPFTHTVTIHEYGGNPGKPDVSYKMTQLGSSYGDGHYDTMRSHKRNARGGVDDPLGEILAHHGRVVGDLESRGWPTIEEVGPHNIKGITPDYPHWTPGWGTDDPGMKRTRFLRPGNDPNLQLHTTSSSQDQPLDQHVHRRLTGGAKGRPRFEYVGRIAPGDPDTDVYHAAYQDPEDPYMRYGFTVRHMPGATSSPVQDYRGETDPLLPKPLPFSYSVTHYPVDILDEGGDYPIGEFMYIGEHGESGDQAPVANFTDVGPLIERHHNVLRSVGLMDLPSRESRPAWQHNASIGKTADDFDDIISGAGSAGPCWACGKATYNRDEGKSLQSDSFVPLRASDETGGEMHGPDINLCGDCSGDDMNYHMAVTHGSRGPNKLWHWNDQGVRGCPECEAHLMDQADEDLRP